MHRHFEMHDAVERGAPLKTNGLIRIPTPCNARKLCHIEGCQKQLQRFSRPLSEQSALRERIPAEGIIRVAHRYCKPLQELLLDLLALQRLLRAALRRDGGTQLNHRICVPVW